MCMKVQQLSQTPCWEHGVANPHSVCGPCFGRKQSSAMLLGCKGCCVVRYSQWVYMLPVTYVTLQLYRLAQPEAVTHMRTVAAQHHAGFCHESVSAWDMAKHNAQMQ